MDDFDLGALHRAVGLFRVPRFAARCAGACVDRLDDVAGRDLGRCFAGFGIDARWRRNVFAERLEAAIRWKRRKPMEQADATVAAGAFVVARDRGAIFRYKCAKSTPR